MPSLQEGIFADSITYLCEHSEQGAMGIVVNHPLDLTVEDVLQHLNLSAEHGNHHTPVMAGGPVQMDRGFVLHRGAEQSWEATIPVCEDVSLTTSTDILTAIAAGKGPPDRLIALGYAGWSAGQLEQEMSANAWLSVPADSDIIFSTPVEHRVQAAAAKLGVDLSLLTMDAGHA